MTEKITTTFTEISDLYIRNENVIIDDMNKCSRWGNGLSIEAQLHYTKRSLNNTINALICALELLKKLDANSTFDSKASSTV